MTICFPDLLVETIEVDEVTLDATVEVIVERENGHYYIDYFKCERLFVCVGDHRFEFTAEEFRTRHKSLYERFKNKCELIALEEAVNSCGEVSA